jgi:hypothetical protein
VENRDRLGLGVSTERELRICCSLRIPNSPFRNHITGVRNAESGVANAEWGVQRRDA